MRKRRGRPRKRPRENDAHNDPHVKKSGARTQDLDHARSVGRPRYASAHVIGNLDSEQFPNGPEEAHRLDGLRHMQVEAGLQCTSPVFGTPESRHRDRGLLIALLPQ